MKIGIVTVDNVDVTVIRAIVNKLVPVNGANPQEQLEETHLQAINNNNWQLVLGSCIIAKRVITGS